MTTKWWSWMKVILAIKCATWAVVKIRPEKTRACTGLKPMTSAIPVQRSTNWAKKPTGSWLLCRFHRREVMNKRLRIYESHIFELRIKTWMKMILAVMCTAWAVVKIRPEKIPAWTGLEPITNNISWPKIVFDQLRERLSVLGFCGKVK